MATNTKQRRAIAFVVVITAAIAIGAVTWSHAADASQAPEPAALAKRGTIKGEQVAQVAAEMKHTHVRGSDLKVRRGRAKGGQFSVGGGDEVVAALTGSLTPTAVEVGDGGSVVYSAWRQISQPKRSDPKTGTGQGVDVGSPIGIPSLRMWDASGKDKLLETGAYSPAVARDGQLAYVRGDTNVVRQNVAYTGKVVVGDPEGGGQPVVWTAASARYFPYAWAGSTLLVYKALPGSEAADLYALEGPGKERLLAPEAFLIALSPDGSRVLVTVGRRMVEIVRVRDGAIEASMPLDGDGVAAPDSPTTPHALMFSGSWYGDRVIANSDVGLVVLNVRDGIKIESVFDTSSFPTGLAEPTLVDDTHFIAWANLGARPGPEATDEPAYENALVECDLSALSCTVGTPAPGRTWTRWVTNPSR